MLKKVFILKVFVCCIVFIAGCGANATPGEDVHEWKMTITVGQGSTWYEGAIKFAEDLERESGGRLSIDVYTNEQLSAGNPEAGVEQLMDGLKDFSYNSSIIYAGIDPRFGVLSAPFLINDINDAERVLNGESGEIIEDMLRERGVEPLGFAESGFRQITNDTQPIRSPEDLDHLKIRIPSMGVFTNLYRTQDADPITMAFSEVYTALQQGTIDGQENPVDVTYSSGLEEVQQYMTMWNYVYDALILGMNKELYDSLSEEDQALIKRVAAEANEYQIALTREKEEEQLAELEEKGMEIYYPSESEIEEFRTSSQPVYDYFEDVWGADNLETFQREADGSGEMDE
ncbi:DctP family TRAP transporter solute-binding subunit [Oceanobacillus jeddahense]|uniref:DctP family TRAP transporter solute-binding subunit n=1 Tax=Oceanobacillus jeddahense TaxID=1462527 RepID=A0ABY5JV85_9BACI|nr:DctP family TRAP transporter solute-binding subunit [Oceanobacillus jeddahense]UUI03068.1 DctP family TRAP transporter solute-binding subunit [Oceanobacillus jeddahense]